MSQSKNQHCLVFHLLEHQLSSKDLNFSELSLEEFLSKWLEMWGCCSDGWRKLAESALLTWMSSREKSKFKTFQNNIFVCLLTNVGKKYLKFNSNSSNGEKSEFKTFAFSRIQIFAHSKFLKKLT